MLEFSSSMSLAVNSKSAAAECVEKAGASAADLLIFFTTVGHNADQVVKAAKEAAPNATVVGCSGSGVISNEGVSEKMRALACMAVTGREQAVSFRAGVHGLTSRQLAAEAAQELKTKLPEVRHVGVFAQGLEPAADLIIAGIEDVLGENVILFGGTSADNGKAKRTIQFCDDQVVSDGLLLIGMADSSLELVSGAHHGSVPIGTPFEITKCEVNHVLEINGEPAWPFLMKQLDAPPNAHPSEVLPIAGLGAVLSDEEAEEYDNSHVLCVSFKVSDDRQTFWLPRSVEPGMRFVLVQRDEKVMFEGVDRLVARMKEKLGGKQPVAVFHADCMARGRLMFDRVLKDEIIARMQIPLTGDGDVPWLGLYGYGEFCELGGRNQFHTYTTSLFPFVRA
jgi:hypothetical protein